MSTISDKRIIAWGRSKLLEFYLTHEKNHRVAFVVDSNAATHGTLFNGLETRAPDAILKEDPGTFEVVVFAVSTSAIQGILRSLNGMGFLLGKEEMLYSDIFYPHFSEKAKVALGYDIEKGFYHLAKSFSLNSRIPVHTTLLGNTLFLALLSDVLMRTDATGAIAEVGSFNGGNAVLASQFMAMRGERPFYIFDSFEGFPKLSPNDPETSKAGDYNIETSYEHILDNFSMFSFAHVIKGFVPQTFSTLPSEEKYGLVFYDCDLYDPALATFEYFWDRIVPGGYMLIHDYVAEKGGFLGVRKATDEFFVPRNIKVHEFWENTMGLAIKPGR